MTCLKNYEIYLQLIKDGITIKPFYVLVPEAGVALNQSPVSRSNV
jgi:hypothetical protein